MRFPRPTCRHFGTRPKCRRCAIWVPPWSAARRRRRADAWKENQFRDSAILISPIRAGPAPDGSAPSSADSAAGANVVATNTAGSDPGPRRM